MSCAFFKRNYIKKTHTYIYAYRSVTTGDLIPSANDTEREPFIKQITVYGVRTNWLYQTQNVLPSKRSQTPARYENRNLRPREFASVVRAYNLFPVVRISRFEIGPSPPPPANTVSTPYRRQCFATYLSAIGCLRPSLQNSQQNINKIFFF